MSRPRLMAEPAGGTLRPPLPGAADGADSLARMLWGMARTRGPVAMRGLAALALNRFAAGGGTLAALCRDPALFPCWHSRPDPDRADSSDPAFALAQRVASRALAGGDRGGLAESWRYHAAEEFPDWSLRAIPLGEAGGLIFYGRETAAGPPNREAGPGR